MNRSILSLLCLCLLWPGKAFAQESGIVTVEGYVLRQDGSPVASAEVEIQPFTATGGILPPPVLTDERGFFHILYPALGQGWVTASKVAEGYPNATFAIYGRGGYESLKQIDLQADVVVKVNLRFGLPDATIECLVVDAGHHFIRNARIIIELADKPEMMISYTVPQDGVFHFVLPKHAVHVIVSAPGFAEWHYRDETTRSASLLAKAGTRVRVEAVLHSTAAR